MGTVRSEIDDRLRVFLEDQPVFFVATAPLAADGRVNVSPKGGRGTLVVDGSHRVAYLDLTASGAETIAHLRENGRITVMACAFEGRPTIVRLHGRGRVVSTEDPEIAEWLPRFPEHPGVRAVIVVDVDDGLRFLVLGLVEGVDVELGEELDVGVTDAEHEGAAGDLDHRDAGPAPQGLTADHGDGQPAGC